MKDVLCLGSQQNQQFTITIIIMQQEPRCAVQAANPLIRLVREMEDLFFELLSFVNEHLQSSSNDLDALTVFNKFILIATTAYHDQLQKNQLFLTTFSNVSQAAAPKQMMRLTSRLIQILEGSLARVRKSVFEQSGRAAKQFSRFRLILNKMMKKETFGLKEYAEHVLSYCSGRYLRQLGKVQRYVEKVGLGQDLWLRDIYHKQNSDVESSPDQRKLIVLQKTLKKIGRRLDAHHFISPEQTDKKMSLKKTVKTSIKRKQRPINIKNKLIEEENFNKQPAATKLLKFYSLLELNKKQFLQDYAYDKLEEERHKNDLFNRLVERNKDINKQINGFIKKSSNCVPATITFSNNHSSGDERNQSTASKLSLRTSFVISKRKPSFHFQSSSGNQKLSDAQKMDPVESTIKNLNPRRRSSHSNHRLHPPQQKSKKIFVVKQPMMFEDEAIPQAQITQTQWLGAQLTVKGRDRKNQNIRLKRKNNPNPMENAFLADTFRYPI